MRASRDARGETASSRRLAASDLLRLLLLELPPLLSPTIPPAPPRVPPAAALPPRLPPLVTDAAALPRPEVERAPERNPEPASEGSLCAICFEKPLDHMFIPCGHVCVCERCAAPLTACPMCREPCTDFMRIYLS